VPEASAGWGVAAVGAAAGGYVGWRRRRGVAARWRTGNC